MNARQRLSFPFPELSYSLLEWNFRKIYQHLKNWAKLNKRVKVWSSAISPLTFWYPSPSLLLKLRILLSEMDINDTKKKQTLLGVTRGELQITIGHWAKICPCPTKSYIPEVWHGDQTDPSNTRLSLSSWWFARNKKLTWCISDIFSCLSD